MKKRSQATNPRYVVVDSGQNATQKDISLFENIRSIIEQARNSVRISVNSAMLKSYWEIGRLIVEDEQNGSERADYGEQTIKTLSEQLMQDYGKGFSKRNLHNMVKLYQVFPIVQTLSAQLSWSHYLAILKMENQEARKWYIAECESSNWSVRALERQINSFYYERLLLSTDKEAVAKETVVKYSSINNQTLFASRYQLYLPTEEELKKELEREREWVQAHLGALPQDDEANL